MILLVTGLLLFVIAHLGTTIGAPLRARVVASIGEIPWKIGAALVLVASVWMIVQGYGDASADALWVAPGWVRYGIVLLMLPALILYMGSYPGSALRARIRHPQLTGFALWALLHLIANGEVRAVILFGGLLAWAIMQIALLNRRDGDAYSTAAHPSSLRAWAAVPIGIVVWIGLLLAHPWLFDVNPLA